DRVFETINGIENPFIRTVSQITASYYFDAWKTETWLNENVRSAFGLAIAGSGGISRSPFGVVLDLSPSTYIFNWRSFELARVMTIELGGTASCCSPWSGSTYATGFIVKGASTNEAWLGPYASASVQGFYTGGAITGVAIGLDKNN